MRPFTQALFPALILTMAVSGCTTPVGPVEVTRFHLPDTSMLGRGPVTVKAAAGQDANSIEFRTYAAALARELARVGYQDTSYDSTAANQVAELKVERQVYSPGQSRSPVSVGVGGGTGSFGSGVGLGLGINLSGPPKDQVETRISVVIREPNTGRSLWEGRASFTVRADAPAAQTALGAAKLTEALFKDFPGQSGQTVTVQ